MWEGTAGGTGKNAATYSDDDDDGEYEPADTNEEQFNAVTGIDEHNVYKHVLIDS